MGSPDLTIKVYSLDYINNSIFFLLIVKLNLKYSYTIVSDAGMFFSSYILFALQLSDIKPLLTF